MKDWKCQECGYQFDKKASDWSTIKCPKCGSEDIDVDVGNKKNANYESKQDKVNRGKDRYGSKDNKLSSEDRKYM